MNIVRSSCALSRLMQLHEVDDMNYIMVLETLRCDGCTKFASKPQALPHRLQVLSTFCYLGISDRCSV